MSWEKPNLLPIWEAQVCDSIRKCESRNAISANRLLEVRGLLQRCSGRARSSVLLLRVFTYDYL
jgi:hypothetical protein